MPDHLLALSLGPVQGFIAAARRTRDLWFGSHLLSEISKAAAEEIRNAGGELIFPHPEALTGDAGVANVILARLPYGVQPADARRRAHHAAVGCWKQHADRAREAARRIINTAIWDEQAGDVIEFYAAAVPLESDAQYPAARARVMRLLAGRKACRDFIPANSHRLPKSSLDGQHDTVLRPREEHNQTLEAAYKHLEKWLRLTPGEQLDAVGMVKRLAGGQHGAIYPSVSRIAADPWLRGLAARAPERLAELRTICERLLDKGLTRVAGERYAEFPYEGAVVFRTRLPELAKESGESQEAYTAVAAFLKRVKDAGFGEADPYLAILAADGDRMGEAISGIRNPDQHRELSRTLAEFARNASETVQSQAHRGTLVYSGGDDVLAFLPVDTCLDCARALHEDFAGNLGAFPGPTLSVGIAIGHFLEPLEDLLAFAREAERDAKGLQNKDGLAVHVHPRSGAPITIRARWPEGMDRQLVTLVEMHARNQIPDKAAYDLRELTLAYEDWPREMAEQKDEIDEAIRADVKRLMKRKRVANPDVWDAVLEGGEGGEKWTAEGVLRMAERILVARRIHASSRQGEANA